MQQKIKFALRKDRDLGDVINATFDFLRIYAPSLYKGLLYIAMPIGLLSGIMAGLFSISMGNIFSIGSMENGLAEIFTWKYFASLGLALLQLVVMAAMVYAFFQLLLKDKQRSEPFSVEQLWQETKGALGKVLGGSLVLGIAFTLMLVGVSLLAGLLITLFPNSAMMVFLLFFAVIFAFGYVGVSLSMYFPVMMLENRDVMTSFGRAYSLVNDRRWSTFLVIFVVMCISWLMSIAVTMPNMILQASMGMNSIDGEAPETWVSILTVLMSGIASAAGTFIQPILYIAITLQYFSLVESQESTGLIEEIGSFGVSEEAQVAEDEGY